MSERSRSVHVVGIGASAGGLEALERFFRQVPADSGLAYVVVQHLSPDFKSLMDEFLARYTPARVCTAEDGLRLERDTVYLLPPGKEMIVSDGRLLLTEKDRSREPSMPVDLFLRSLARDAGEKAVAVILSGTGSDGSRGIRDVHEAGGLVVVQDPETAKFDGMPRMALDTGVADLVLAPERMPDQLADYVLRVGGGRPVDRTPARDALARVLVRLRDATGIDFSNYKPTTVSRRIERRLALHRDLSLEAYAARVEESEEELEALHRDLLIGVTRFFRDEDAFERLAGELDGLVGRLDAGEELRAWVAGCSTGEEAYTLAMLVREAFQRAGRPVAAKIFATDVDRGALEIAGAGIYPAASVAEVHPDRRQTFFVARGGGFEVVSELRQMIVFAPHDLMRDAPFTRLDLVSSRNLVMYFEPQTQKKVFSLFHFGLKREGVLFLGSSESPGILSGHFEAVDEHFHLYRKVRDGAPVELRPPARRPERAYAGTPTSQLLGVYDAILEQYVPPALLVDEDRRVVHSFGGANRFLRMKDGRTSLDLLELVGPSLRMPLVGALQRVRRENTSLSYGGVTFEGDPVRYRVGVHGVRGPKTRGVFTLVTFEAEARQEPPSIEAEPVPQGQMSQEHVEHLEEELATTRENLQATIEELETSNEELQATNEELTASNEELQSTNEELQSVNEELYTVNAEFQKKIQELRQLTADMENLLASTDVGTVFLDGELQVRRFTPRIAETFRLQPRDVGRHIGDITHGLDDPDLLDDLGRVARGHEPVEREVRDRDGNWFLLRILPYLASPQGGVGEGVVLTLVDMGAVKAAEGALYQAEHLLRGLLLRVRESIDFTDADGRFVRVNPAFASAWGLVRPEDALGRTPSEVLPSEGRDRVQADVERVLRDEGVVEGRLDRRLRHDGATSWELTTRLPLLDADGRIVGTFGVSRDVTEQRNREARSEEEVRRRDTFLAMLSHELRNPLAAIFTATDLLGEALGPTAAVQPLRVLRRQTGHMSRLLGDLMDVSRLTRGKVSIKQTPTDLREVVEEATRSFDSRFEAAEVSLEVRVPDAPVVVDGDPGRLQQIVANLLSNAVKYSRPGSKVVLRLELVDDEALVSVEDQGIGIAPDKLEEIFELFFQDRLDPARSGGGLGLGLGLVKLLVELHGGSVRAYSDGPGTGAEVVVRLPRSAASAAVTADPARSVDLGSLSGLRVVVVEDLPDNRTLLAQVLEREGCEVYTAPDGASGRALIARHRPDVALIDIGLPDLNGHEVARSVRRDSGLEAVRLVALTGYGRPSDRRAALEAGFDRHLVKPVAGPELKLAIARVTGRLLEPDEDQRPPGDGDRERAS